MPENLLTDGRLGSCGHRPNETYGPTAGRESSSVFAYVCERGEGRMNSAAEAGQRILVDQPASPDSGPCPVPPATGEGEKEA